jgi:hypothetical protein
MKAVMKKLIISLILSFCLVLPGISYARIDPNTAIAIWTFDQGQGDVLKDSSGNGINGKLVNNPKWVAGKIGSALQFDGKATYVDCGNNPLLAPTTNQLTVTAWVFCTGSGKISIIENNSDNWGFRFAEAVPTLDAYVDPDGTDIHIYGQNIPQSEWVHLCFVWDGKTGTLYQNAKKIAEATIAVKMRPLLSGFAIGRRGANTASQYFTGIIDEIGVFNVALTEDNVKSIMTEGLETATGIAAVSPTGKLTQTWASIKNQ